MLHRWAAFSSRGNRETIHSNIILTVQKKESIEAASFFKKGFFSTHFCETKKQNKKERIEVKQLKMRGLKTYILEFQRLHKYPNLEFFLKKI